jgi:hypothetical protein
MHENREISCTSCSKEQDQSAKAINRTADIHVQEKSGYAVVPVNLSNKEAQASAESGEGRAQTKENIVQSHKLPTQSGKGLSKGLRGVRQAARERKQERFTACFFPHLSGSGKKQGGTVKGQKHEIRKSQHTNQRGRGFPRCSIGVGSQ